MAIRPARCVSDLPTIGPLFRGLEGMGLRFVVQRITFLFWQALGNEHSRARSLDMRPKQIPLSP